jgi:hypothetical protein
MLAPPHVVLTTHPPAQAVFLIDTTTIHRADIHTQDSNTILMPL